MEKERQIIEEIINEAVNGILELVSDNLSQMNYSDIVQTVQMEVNQLGASLIERIVAITDDCYNRQRNKHRIVIRNNKTRKMVSQMGDITLIRKLYYDKKKCKYFFAVDELLNIEKYSRIDIGLKRKLVSDATMTSYGKASALSDNKVSRQTVFNLVSRIPKKQLAAKANGFKKINKLYIEADEDHIHLNTGKSAEVKLVYVHEGRQKINKKRTELLNVKYFASVSGGTEIWNTVADYIFYQYDTRNAEIHISGDGANWIKYALDVFPGAEFHLDKFHVFQSVTDATAGDAALRRKIIEFIKADNKEGVHRLYAQRWQQMNTVASRRSVNNSISYIDKNFEAIDLSENNRCCAEGHVSHVLSARMSSRPMGWSKAGAERIARLRVFYYNGGDFSKLKFYNENTKGKKTYNVVNSEKPFDHSIPSVNLVGRDGLTDNVSKVLRSLMKIRTI